MALTLNRRTILGIMFGAALVAAAAPHALRAEDKFIEVQSTT